MHRGKLENRTIFFGNTWRHFCLKRFGFFYIKQQVWKPFLPFLKGRYFLPKYKRVVAANCKKAHVWHLGCLQQCWVWGKINVCLYNLISREVGWNKSNEDTLRKFTGTNNFVLKIKLNLKLMSSIHVQSTQTILALCGGLIFVLRSLFENV